MTASPHNNLSVQRGELHPTHELLDITGWFTAAVASGPPIPTTQPPASQPPTTPAPTSPTTPPPTEPDGKIAFARSNQIYTIDPDGTDEAKLTSGDKNYWPRWSPNGQQIAYVHETAASHEVWLMNADGTGKRKLATTGTSFGVDWSPDGTRIVLPTSPVTIITLATGEVETLRGVNVYWNPGEPVQDFYIHGTPTWSADGTRIAAYSENVSGLSENVLGYFDLTRYEFGAEASNRGVTCETLGEPTFSSDGAFLAYMVIEEVWEGDEVHCTPSRIKTKAINGAAVPALTSLDYDRQIAFAPSGTRTVIMNDSFATAKLYTAAANGTGRTFLVNGYQPDWEHNP
ncbi:MAG: TolB family protein [Ilumatobacteraceae bacterium]